MGIYLFNILSLPIYKAIFKSKKIFCALIALQLFFILALRDVSVGTDLPTYSAGFEYIGSLSFLDMISKLRFIRASELIYPFSFESGYVILNWLIAKVGLGFHSLLVICAAVNSLSIGYFIYKYSDNSLLSFAIFISFNMYSYCFSALRQSLALSIVLFAVPLIMKKKKIAAGILILIAFFFHRLAIVAIPIIFLSNIRITRSVFGMVSFVGCIFLMLSPILFHYVLPDIFTQIGYGSYDTFEFKINNLFLLMLLIFIIIYLFVDFSCFHNEILNVACWGFICAIFVEIFGLYNDVIARAVELNMVFITILIPGIIFTYHNKKIKFLAEITVYSLMVIFMVYSYSFSNIGIIPYQLFG